MKVLFTDLDGTLLNSDSVISPTSIDILQRFIDEGNMLVPASGRPLLSMQKVIESSGLAPFVSYMIAYNGALIWNCQKNEPVHEWRVPLEYAKLIFEETKRMGLHVQTYYNETIYTPIHDKEIDLYRSKVELPVIYDSNPLSIIDGDPYKVLSIHLSDHDLLCTLKENVIQAVNNSADTGTFPLSIQFSNPWYLEFFNAKAGKGNALVKFCELNNIDINNTYAAGDEENDISMIEAAGCGIAMQNAKDAVKHCANVVTEFTNADDGLCLFIKDNLFQA